MVLLHTYLNSSNYITDNVSLTSDLLRTSVEEYIFLSAYLSFFSTDLPGFFHVQVLHDLHRTTDLIFKNLNILRVITYLL